MSAQVLVSRPLHPQSIPVQCLPSRTVQPAHNTGQSSSSGLATSGFRTAKYLLEEWRQGADSSGYQAAADRGGSESLRGESKQLAAECEARTRRSQADATKQLGQRLLDIHFWQSELGREIRDVTAETELLLQQKQRLERGLDATEIPLSIASDNLQCRERRAAGELVRDGPEEELLREVELIRNIQELLKRTLEQTVQQISTSTPETWAQYSHEIIYKAERERIASINLRSLIDNILQDTAEDLQTQCNTVNSAFAQRCEEMEDAKRKMESHLRNILNEIGGQEKNIAALKQAIKDKEAPVKVAESRLYERSYRPNVELCRDPAQFRLVSEVGELTESIEFLKQKLEEAEQSLRNLEDTRMSLEKDIAYKTNALFIDRQKCMTHRTRYPVLIKLTGYQ
ncbi:tektin-4 isoform X2 [Pseudophryne corroboree]|uniref:tektin-4 isoform X2 n=1 Tax=Pseudophryne corroboree TaxID=495146 RepID=UPI003081B63A